MCPDLRKAPWQCRSPSPDRPLRSFHESVSSSCRAWATCGWEFSSEESKPSSVSMCQVESEGWLHNSRSCRGSRSENIRAYRRSAHAGISWFPHCCPAPPALSWKESACMCWVCRISPIPSVSSLLRLPWHRTPFPASILSSHRPAVQYMPFSMSLSKSRASLRVRSLTEEYPLPSKPLSLSLILSRWQSDDIRESESSCQCVCP